MVPAVELSPTALSLCNSTFRHLAFLHRSRNRTHLASGSVFGNGDDKLRVFAIKNGRKSGTAVVEMDSSEDVADEYSDFDDEFLGVEDDEGDGDGDDEGMFLPLGKLKKWLEKKPRGFGEGKVYDTSIEDKLLDEMRQSREAQIANINKLKNNPIKPDSKKDHQKKKAPEVITSRIRVRLVNLPKKKNIHRDLQAAFEGVSGIIDISPAVSGNKKTKDPICKGFAFVDFKSEDDAIRFVQRFCGYNLAFGRRNKQIRCEMMNALCPNLGNERSPDNACITTEPAVAASEEGLDADSDGGNFSSGFSLEAAFGESEDLDDEGDVEIREESDKVEMKDIEEYNMEIGDESDKMEIEDIRHNLEMVSATMPTSDTDPTLESISSNQQRKPKTTKKKLPTKGKQQKVPKLDIPGSAKRLKIKEKAVLTGVFSKYGGKTASS
ncbi:hypothetical protein SLE2022_202670 [Rubroshorea leprosula]